MPNQSLQTAKNIVGQANRLRHAVYATICGAFTALFAFITVRFAIGGDVVETLMLLALTSGLGYQTRRWYRRARAAQ